VKNLGSCGQVGRQVELNTGYIVFYISNISNEKLSTQISIKLNVITYRNKFRLDILSYFQAVSTKFDQEK
jgi:hypothetical protein